jgi:hypothetical protein
VVKNLACGFRTPDDQDMMIDFTGKVKCHITTNSPLQQDSANQHKSCSAAVYDWTSLLAPAGI